MKLATLALSAALTCGQAAAAERGDVARYAFAPVEEGVLRLDTETGEVMRCSESGDAAACVIVSESPAEEGDKVRLQARVAVLEKRIAMLEHGGAAAPDNVAMMRVATLAGRMMDRLFSLVREENAEDKGV
jgi:hypothetical protein